MSNIITPEFRVAFPHVFQKEVHTDPKSDKPGTPKFSLIMLFGKAVDLSEMKKAYLDIAKEAFGKNVPKKIGLYENFKDNKIEEKTYAGYDDNIFVRATSGKADLPVVDADGKILKEEKEFYAGCYARASLSVFVPRNRETNAHLKLVMFLLNGIQKTRDGEPLVVVPDFDVWNEFGLEKPDVLADFVY